MVDGVALAIVIFLVFYSLILKWLNGKHPVAAAIVTRKQGWHYFVMQSLFDPLVLKYPVGHDEHRVAETDCPEIVTFKEQMLVENTYISLLLSMYGGYCYHDCANRYGNTVFSGYQAICVKRMRRMERIELILYFFDILNATLFGRLTGSGVATVVLTQVARFIIGQGLPEILHRVAYWEVVTLPIGYGFMCGGCDMLNPKAVWAKLQRDEFAPELEPDPKDNKDSKEQSPTSEQDEEGGPQRRSKSETPTNSESSSKDVESGAVLKPVESPKKSSSLKAILTPKGEAKLDRHLSMERALIPEKTVRYAMAANIMGKTLTQCVILGGLFFGVVGNDFDASAVVASIFVSSLIQTVQMLIGRQMVLAAIKERSAWFYFNVYDDENPTKDLDMCGGTMREYQFPILGKILNPISTCRENLGKAKDIEIWGSLESTTEQKTDNPLSVAT